MNKKKILKFINKIWKEWRITILIVVFVIIPTKSSIADWNWVPSGSMNPTILEGDLVFIDKIAYGLRLPLTFHRLFKWSDPQRGDVVICFSPEDETRLIKRVIGRPSDIIEMKNNVLLINNQPARYTKIEPKYTEYFHADSKSRVLLATEDLEGLRHAVMSTPSTRAMRSFGPVTVPTDNYFVMGDNRDNSRDSRIFGFVERKAIVGKAKAVIISFDITDKFKPRLKRFLTAFE